MIPVVALVGRPNVGKSTLFNRLTRTRDALVADFPGLTRDRKYGRAEVEGREFICIDTGGIDGNEEGVETRMAEQSLLAIEEADVVLFMVDARAGLMPADSAIAKHLRSNVRELEGALKKVLAYASALNYTEGVRPEDQFPNEATTLVQQGFRALKMRTGRFELRRDLAVLAKVRETVGADIRLLTDANGAFTLPQAVKFGKELENLDFYCFEEPLPQGLNYAGYDTLTQSLDIAIAGGEVLDSRTAARDHIAKRFA